FYCDQRVLHPFPTRRSSDLTNLGMYRVSKDKSGIASGLVNFSHLIGSSTGIVLDLVIATFIIRYIGATNNDITLIAILIGTVIQDRKSTRLNSSHVSISYAV